MFSFSPYRPIQPLAEILGLLELAQHPVHKMRVGEACVGEVAHQQPVALLEEVGMGMVLGIAVGHALHGVAGVEAESVGLGDGFGQRLAVEEDLVADGLQHGRVGHVHPRAEHVARKVFRLLGLHVEIIAAQHRLLTFGADKHAEVGLVGPLVGREARVAIETVGAVFQGQAFAVVVKLLHAFDDLLGDGVEVGLRLLVLLLMLLKPRAVVVVEHGFEEFENIFHGVKFWGKGNDFLRITTTACKSFFTCPMPNNDVTTVLWRPMCC